MQDVSIRVIARMKSDFATKFGIPRQSGLVEELRSTIVFEPEFRNPDSVRPVWVEMPGWVSSPPGLPSAPITWDCPA